MDDPKKEAPPAGTQQAGPKGAEAPEGVEVVRALIARLVALLAAGVVL